MHREKGKPLPFTVDRRIPTSLADQLADGLRQAIQSGYYKPGESIPRLKEMASQTGTSLRIPREALERLKNEGVIDPRRALGSLVTGKALSRWRGHVLFVLNDSAGSYYANVFADVLQANLTNAGYLFTRATVFEARGNAATAALDAALAQSVTLAVLFGGVSRKIAARLDARGVPFVEIARTRSKLGRSVAFVQFNREAAISDFVAHCAERGAKSVLQVCFKNEGDIDAAPALRAAGIAVRKLVVPAPAGTGRLEKIQRKAMEMFGDLLAAGKRPDADVVLFTDDFLASGALAAVGRAGLRIPEDLSVVTFANAGFGPVYPRTLTRFVMDPVAHGETAARLLLDHLDKKAIPPDAALNSAYCRGESF